MQTINFCYNIARVYHHEVKMKKLFILFALVCMTAMPVLAANTENKKENVDFTKIGFHKRTDLQPQIQMKDMFKNYQRYLNCKDVDKFLSVYDDSYKSSDGYGKDKLKLLAEAVVKNYPDMKYDIKVISIDVDVDNATIITREKLSASVDSNIQYIKGKGYIDAESTNIYYLKRFSNEWRITSDFIINEKTAVRYGLAKYVPMLIDAPSLVAPGQEYTAVLKMSLPDKYKALISIDNDPISYPEEKIPETFRGLKPSGIQERILYSNKENKNENATASIGIVKADIKEDNINVNIVGLGFLSSRVNVIEQKSDNFVINTDAKQQGGDKQISPVEGQNK